MSDSYFWIQGITFFITCLLVLVIINNTENDDDDDMGPGSMVPAWNGIQG